MICDFLFTFNSFEFAFVWFDLIWFPCILFHINFISSLFMIVHHQNFNHQHQLTLWFPSTKIQLHNQLYFVSISWFDHESIYSLINQILIVLFELPFLSELHLPFNLPELLTKSNNKRLHCDCSDMNWHNRNAESQCWVTWFDSTNYQFNIFSFNMLFMYWNGDFFIASCFGWSILLLQKITKNFISCINSFSSFSTSKNWLFHFMRASILLYCFETHFIICSVIHSFLHKFSLISNLLCLKITNELL